MALWCDKYRPKDLDELDYQLKTSEMLRKLVLAGDFPHLLVYGPSGAGKRVRVHAVLRELYGNGALRVRLEQKSVETPTGKKLQFSILQSNYHVQLNASDAGIYDRFVVQDVIKNMAQMKQLDTGAQKEFKVVVLDEADCLTREAQHALRRTMEKYMATCRLILVTNCLSKIISPVRSRCLSVRVSGPSNEDIVKILQKVASFERIHLPDDFANRIAVKSEGNLRRAINSLEVCYVQNYPFLDNQKIDALDWQVYLKDTASIIVNKQTPRAILEVRERVYELLSRLIPTSLIFEELVRHICRQVDAGARNKIVELAAEFEHRNQLGSKPVIHIEAFVAETMSCIQQAHDDINNLELMDD